MPLVAPQHDVKVLYFYVLMHDASGKGTGTRFKYKFVNKDLSISVLFGSPPAPNTGPPHGVQALTHSHIIFFPPLHEFAQHACSMNMHSLLKRLWGKKTCDRWLLRLLHWNLVLVAPRQQWDDMLKTFCRYQRVGEWELAAQDPCNWERLMPEFINFSIGSCRSKFERQIPLLCTCNSFFTCAFRGPPSGLHVSLAY